jgi:hypothetical protein
MYHQLQSDILPESKPWKVPSFIESIALITMHVGHCLSQYMVDEDGRYPLTL